MHETRAVTEPRPAGRTSSGPLQLPLDRRTLLGLIPLAALVAACGGDDGTGAGTTADTNTTVPDGGSPDTTSAPIEHGAVLLSAAARRPADAADAGLAARSLNQLGARIYEQLVADADSPNLVLSPASVAIALAMTRVGAVGTTADEMDAVLGVDAASGGSDELHRSMNALTAELSSRTGTFTRGDEEVELILALANAPWAQAGLAIERAFLDVLATEYGAGLRVVDYLGDAEGARVAINDWVDDETRGRIPELLTPGTVTADTRLVLVNAVYLKAPWARAFQEAATDDATFLTLDGDEVSVPMMSTRHRMPTASGPGWQAVELPYADDTLAMLLVLPDQEHLLAERLVDGLLDEVVDELEPAEVILRLPRFDIGTTAPLGEVLRTLGMVTAFTGDADFSAITTDEHIAVAEVLHEANITVDEDGTEAAAATAVMMEATSAPIDEPVELVFDRPFLFAVRDRVTGAITFLGRIGDPSVTRT